MPNNPLVIGKKEHLRVLFRINNEQSELDFCFIHPARIKRLEPALALTIHKAQGSEADQVILLWPNKPLFTIREDFHLNQNNSYERRLLYTAITRAKNRIDVIKIKDLRFINLISHFIKC